MENAEIKIVRFESTDAIATSLCSRSSTPSQLFVHGAGYEEGGEIFADSCGWFINGEGYYYNDENPFGDWNKGEEYFANGTKIADDDWCYLVNTGLWYHYEDGNYYLCDNASHHQ